MLNQVEIEVSDSDIDELGHVNNARFLEYFERGRIGWYNSIGLFNDASFHKRLGTVVVSMKINFRRECFSGDRLSVLTAPRTRGKRSYLLYQEIRNNSGALVADAEVSNVVMDLDRRATVDLPGGLAKQFETPAEVKESSQLREKK